MCEFPSVAQGDGNDSNSYINESSPRLQHRSLYRNQSFLSQNICQSLSMKFSAILPLVAAVAAWPQAQRQTDVKPWSPAGSSDSRSPCPMLNTLANHGYLYVYYSLSHPDPPGNMLRFLQPTRRQANNRTTNRAGAH